MTQEFIEHSKEITSFYLDGQPYDRLRLVNEAKFCFAQSAQQMLEGGRRLLVIREHEPHGDFESILERDFDMSSRVAQRIMQAATKYLSPKLKKQTEVLQQLGKSKLYELILEDDDELAELAEGGTVAGLKLDDIDRMSCRELRKHLREAEKITKAKDDVIASKDKKINDLTVCQKKITPSAPDEVSEQIRSEAQQICMEAEQKIYGPIREAIEAVSCHALANNIFVDSWMKGQMNQLYDALDSVFASVGLTRSHEDSLTAWTNDMDDGETGTSIFESEPETSQQDDEENEEVLFMSDDGSFAVSVEQRKKMVKTFTQAQCERALNMEGLQKGVITEINRRLREFEQE